MFQNQNQDPNFYLAATIANNVKSAAVGVGGQQAIPTSFGNYGSGLTDPNPAYAQMSVQSQTRVQNNQMNYQDQQVSGTNLTNYGPVLPTNFQTVNTAVQAGMPVQKMANTAMQTPNVLDGQISPEDFPALMQQLGQAWNLEYMPETPEQWNQLVDMSSQEAVKAASARQQYMLASGYIDQFMPDEAPLFRAIDFNS